MLTRSGFFHVMEASSSSDLVEIIKRDKKNHFILIELALINEQTLPLLNNNKFIIISQPNDQRVVSVAARFGVEKFLNFPFSSQNLITKIQQRF